VPGCKWPGVACALDPPIETHGVYPGGTGRRNRTGGWSCRPLTPSGTTLFADRTLRPDLRRPLSVYYLLLEETFRGEGGEGSGGGGTAKDRKRELQGGRVQGSGFRVQGSGFRNGP
jgi:hypothetical protein